MANLKKDVSRQRKWQKKKVAEGKCSKCSEPLFDKELCKKHYLNKKIRQRESQGSEPWVEGGPGRPPKCPD